MIFSNGALLQQRNLAPDTLSILYSEIKKHRVEPTSESEDGRSKKRILETLQECCVDALVSRATPSCLGFSVDNLLIDLRLRLFQEIAKYPERVGDSTIELLKGSGITYIRLTRNVTDEGLSMLGKICPQLERAFLRITYPPVGGITLNGLTSFVEQCPNLTWLDIGWTKVFDNATEDQTERFFRTLPPTLSHLCLRGTGLQKVELRMELISKYCRNLHSLNLGKLQSPKHIEMVVASCPNIVSLYIDRILLTDEEFLSIIKICGERLVTLDLGDTLCTDRGMEMVAEYCPNLKTLVLRNLPIGDGGLMAVFRTVKKLKSIDLGGCYELTDTAIYSLSEIETMEEVNLEGLCMLTEKSIQQVVDKCKKLKKLEVPENAMQISRSFRTSVVKGREWNKYNPVVVHFL